MRKLSITADEFAERVSKATNGRISIVKESYTGTRHKVTAYCNVHKIYFEVKIAYNLVKKDENCPKCTSEQRHKANVVPFSVMLQRFKDAYGEKFSYDESSYCGRKKPMKVHCNDCDEDFEITPEHHLKYNNGGCPNCHKTKTVKCSKCGKDVVVDRRSPVNINYICEDCINKIKQAKELSKKKRISNFTKKQTHCKICGRELINGKCQNEFCIKYKNVKFGKLAKYFNFDLNKLGTLEVEQEFNRIRDMLYDLYWNKHMSSNQITQKVNMPCNSIFSYFKLFEIPTKSISYAVKENIEEERVTYKIQNHFHGRYESHITWDNKQIFLRSINEIKYAEELDSKKILYEYESLRIKYFDTQKNDYRYAIPDFYLIETNTIVEIKSSYTLDVVNMRDRQKEFENLGYNFKLIFDFKEMTIDEILENNLYDYDKNKNILKRAYRYKNSNIKDGRKCIIVNKDGIYKKCYTNEELNEYLNNGWSLGTGRHIKTAGTSRVVRINEQGFLEYKHIKRSELQEYLNNGWFKGKTPKHKILEILKEQDTNT